MCKHVASEGAVQPVWHRLFATTLCHDSLPRLFATTLCHDSLPRLFATTLCHELPLVISVVKKSWNVRRNWCTAIQHLVELVEIITDSHVANHHA